MDKVFNIGQMTSNLLNSIDNAAKETLEEPKESATAIRNMRKAESNAGARDDNQESTTDVEASSVSTEHYSSVTPASITSPLRKSENATGSTSSSIQRTKSQDFESVQDATGSENTLKATVKKKTKEIEKLNAECLELEDSVASLKKEVVEAWENYRHAQERAAAREEELQDEISALHKAKSTDKQQLQQQISRFQEDASELINRVKAVEAERDAANDQIESMESEAQEWEAKENGLREELKEAKASSVQGVDIMRQNLQSAEEALQNMQIEHSSILRQNQTRQAELEREMSELSVSLGEKDKEVQRLQSFLQQSDRDDASTKELQYQRDQVHQLSERLEEEQTKYIELQATLRQRDNEMRAAAIRHEDERQRDAKMRDSLEARKSELEDKVKDAQRELRVRLGASYADGPNNSASENDPSLANTISSSSGNVGTGMNVNITVRDLTEQVQNLSKLLLQGRAKEQDLQAEKSALKSQVSDYKHRCSKAEQQLAYYRDPEFEGGDFGDSGGDAYSGSAASDYYFSSSTPAGGSGGSGGLTRRGNKSGGEGGARRRMIGEKKIMSELEQIGVRAPPTVTKAVNIIDSWTLVSTRVLRANSLIRLAFLMYLLLLHVWVFVILAMHVHELDIESDPKEFLHP